MKGNAPDRLEERLSELYSGELYLLGNARSAEYLFLKSLNIAEGSNVAIQAFTCNAVVNPILWLGLEPRYIDIDEKDFSMSLESLKERVDKNTKVIILQHTFGIEAKVKQVVEFAKERGIYVLEDVAHALGNREIGNIGDASIVSFGVDKVLNTTAGGALVINNDQLVSNFEKLYSDIQTGGQWETGVLVKQPIFWFLSKFLGTWIFKKLGFINIGFKQCELFGVMPKEYPRKLSNALAELVLGELDSLKKNLDHRKIISKMYADRLGKSYSEIPLLWYPYIAKDVKQRQEIGNRLVGMGYRAGDWYRPAVYPSENHLELMGYELGSCPVAENLGGRIVGLQTGLNINAEDVEKIVGAVLGS